MSDNFVFKILMLGDAGVGKTSLLQRFTENRYTAEYQCTLGIESRIRTVEIAGRRVKLHIWDTAGEERFRSVMSSYYRHMQGIILMFDTTQRASYLHVDYWLNEIKKYASANVCIMLVGSKCDKLERRQVTQQAAAVYAEILSLPYLEVSAVTGANVERLFGKLAANIYDVYMISPKSKPPNHEEECVIISSKDMAAGSRKRLSNFCCFF